MTTTRKAARIGPHLFRDTRPSIFEARFQLGRALWRDGKVEVRLRELIRLKSGQLAGCSHCNNLRIADAYTGKQPLTEATIVELQDYYHAKDLTEKEKTALMWAELVITAPDSITDSFFEEMRRFFSDDEIAELTYFTLFNNMEHKFIVAMAEPPSDHTYTRTLQTIYDGNF